MSESKTNKPGKLRIVYAAGPGNVIGTYRAWKAGRDDPSQTALTYSAQFFDVCKKLDAWGLVLCSQNHGVLRDEEFTIRSLPIPFQGSSALKYHLGQLAYGIALTVVVVRNRADVVLIPFGTHWFVLSILRCFGIQIVPTLHSMLWHKYRARGKLQRVIHRLNRRFFVKDALAVMSASEDITEQLVKLTGGRHRPIISFLPTYRRETFESIPAPDTNRSSFSVLYLGRIEEDKGVYDLLDVARQLKAAGRADIEFDLCGDGSELKRLKDLANREELSKTFRCHGHLSRDGVRKVLTRSHVVVVPTTTDCVEGFNQVVVEGVLAGRPVVSSGVCPAIHGVRDAVVEVQPDDVNGYLQAILRLRDDRDFFTRFQTAAIKSQEKFYDTTRGFRAGLEHILQAYMDRQDPAPLPRHAERKRHGKRGPVTQH